MKLRIDVDGETYTLDLQPSGLESQYTLNGATHSSGTASVAEIAPGVFSVLLGLRSFPVHLVPNGENLEVWIGAQRHTISIADSRDRAAKQNKAAAAGRIELRAQMPGRVIKLLAEVGSHVQAGQGIIIVEAMKMQNEMKSPKEGTVSKILVGEGATVAAGETLVVIE